MINGTSVFILAPDARRELYLFTWNFLDFIQFEDMLARQVIVKDDSLQHFEIFELVKSKPRE